MRNNQGLDPNSGSNVQQQQNAQASSTHLMSTPEPQYQNQYGHQVSLSPDTHSSPSSLNNYHFDEPMPLPDVVPEDYLASMQAINNPHWWDHVMMPGFSWPGTMDQNQNHMPAAAEQNVNVMTAVADPNLALNNHNHNHNQQLQQRDFAYISHDSQPMLHRHQHQR
jgi:hypothetical protein